MLGFEMGDQGPGIPRLHRGDASVFSRGPGRWIRNSGSQSFHPLMMGTMHPVRCPGGDPGLAIGVVGGGGIAISLQDAS